MSQIAWQATVQDDEGNIVENPSITVHDINGTLANIFDEGGSPISNPFEGTADGFVQFFAEAGEYRIQGAKGGSLTHEWIVDLVPFNENINALAGLSGSSDQIPVFTGPSTMGLRGITQSPTDTTEGRLMKVGDFGLGRAGGPDLEATSLFGRPSGICGSTLGITLEGTPPNANAAVLTMERNSNRQAQLAIKVNTAEVSQPEVWVRAGDLFNGVPNDWAELYSNRSILGTVSQSDGIPTGAVFERDSNDDGQWTRFADGLQIMTRDADVDLTDSGGQTFDFPTQAGGPTQIYAALGWGGAPGSTLSGDGRAASRSYVSTSFGNQVWVVRCDGDGESTRTANLTAISYWY